MSIIIVSEWVRFHSMNVMTNGSMTLMCNCLLMLCKVTSGKM